MRTTFLMWRRMYWNTPLPGKGQPLPALMTMAGREKENV